MSTLASLKRQMTHYSFKRMVMHINSVHKQLGGSRNRIFLDMIWCEMRYGVGYLDYDVFGFAKNRGKIRKTYFTSEMNQTVTKLKNKREYYYLLEDKLKANHLFSDLLKKDYLNLSEVNSDQLKQFCNGKKQFSRNQPTCMAEKESIAT